MIPKLLACIAAGYLIGSVSSAILLSRYICHRDVRSAGSGNAGAANAARVFGTAMGAATFLGDFLKGIVAMALGKWLLGSIGLAAAGIACLLGHCFPVYFGFKGGKAVSTGAAVAFMIDWRLFILCMVVFLLAALLSHIASVSSMLAAFALAAGAFFFTQESILRILAVFTFGLVVFMHRSNIARLMKGTEPKFQAGKR